MEYRRFGKTGWKVSRLSLGTVELGLDYGIYLPGESKKPTNSEAIRLLIKAFEYGINFVDTAPVYGASESIIGEALKQWPEHIYIATKIGNIDASKNMSRQHLQKTIIKSIEKSLKNLKRDTIDLIQIHNATVKDFRESDLLGILVDAQQKGKVRHIGASVYETDAALEALDHPEIAALQVAYNLLDQRMAAKVFKKSQMVDVAIVVRSALLKGALSERYSQLPAHLQKLREAVEKVRKWSIRIDDSLSNTAIRFCLSNNQLATVLLGVCTIEELRMGIDATAKPIFSRMQLKEAEQLAVNDENIIDPRKWGIP